MNTQLDTTLSGAQQLLVDTLLPGFGYFGATADTSLKVVISSLIDRVELAIDGPAAEFLNIQTIKFYDGNGKELDRNKNFKSVEISSLYGKDTQEIVYDKVVRGQTIHSQSEARPTLKIELNKPVWISRIEILNRADQFSRRARWLNVSASLGETHAAGYANITADRALEDVQAVCEAAGFDGALPTDEAAIPEFCEAVKTSIVAKIEQDDLTLNTRQLMQLLPVATPNPRMSAFVFTICAQLTLNMWKGRKVIATRSLVPVSGILSIPHRIKLLQTELERLIEVRRGTPTKVVIARHLIHESRLIVEKKMYLDAMTKVIGILADKGIDAMLGYGTLLGAYRDNSFLPHDDDVDLIVYDGSKTKEEADAGRKRIIALLKQHNIPADSGQPNLWHLQAFVDGAVVDLFPAWCEGDKFFLSMEKLRLRDVPTRCMLPTTKMALYGIEYPIPAGPAEFLEDRYGSGWKVPDPFFEWPWQLS